MRRFLQSPRISSLSSLITPVYKTVSDWCCLLLQRSKHAGRIRRLQPSGFPGTQQRQDTLTLFFFNLSFLLSVWANWSKILSPCGQVRDLLDLQALTPNSWQQSCRRCPSSRAPLPALPACLPPPLPPPARPSPARPPWARNATAARQVQGLQKKKKSVDVLRVRSLNHNLTTLNKHPVPSVRQHHPQLNMQSHHLQASASSLWAISSAFYPPQTAEGAKTQSHPVSGEIQVWQTKPAAILKPWISSRNYSSQPSMPLHVLLFFPPTASDPLWQAAWQPDRSCPTGPEPRLEGQQRLLWPLC